jgi:hypothetical protein
MQDSPPLVLLPHELPEPATPNDEAVSTDDVTQITTPESSSTTDAHAELVVTPATEVADTSADAQNKTSILAQESQSFNSRLAAWQLGSKLSLAALANDRGVAKDKVASWLAQSRQLATTLNTVFAALPPTGAADQSGKPSRGVLRYLSQHRAQIVHRLSQHHGAGHAALFDVAVNSNMLLVLYQPGSPDSIAITAAIGESAAHSELPSELVEPLLESISSGADPVEVRKQVQRFHAEVERRLGGATER